jgi:queuine tRNA-ribosyltransferase
MGRIRTAILEDRYPAFCKDFFAKYFEGQPPPEWAVDALKGVGIDI